MIDDIITSEAPINVLIVGISSQIKYPKDIANINAWGGIITKSVTRYPREGNPPPRITETPSGMLNSIGLANIQKSL